MHILPPQKMNLNIFKNEKLDNLNSENIEYSNFEDEEISSIELNNLDFECCKFKDIFLPHVGLEGIAISPDDIRVAIVYQFQAVKLLYLLFIKIKY